MPTFQEIMKKLKELDEFVQEQNNLPAKDKRELAKAVRDLEDEARIRALDPLKEIDLSVLPDIDKLDNLISQTKSDTQNQLNKVLAIKQIVSLVKEMVNLIHRP
jgi:hypothetical protein